MLMIPRINVIWTKRIRYCYINRGKQIQKLNLNVTSMRVWVTVDICCRRHLFNQESFFLRFFSEGSLSSVKWEKECSTKGMRLYSCLVKTVEELSLSVKGRHFHQGSERKNILPRGALSPIWSEMKNTLPRGRGAGRRGGGCGEASLTRRFLFKFYIFFIFWSIPQN